MLVRFIVGYDQEIEYEIDRVRYRVRYGMYDGNAGADHRDEVRSRIGTVMHRDCSRWNEFPPREVVALFPGLVGARYSPATMSGPGPWFPEYDGGAQPAIVQKWRGWMLEALADDQDSFFANTDAAHRAAA